MNERFKDYGQGTGTVGSGPATPIMRDDHPAQGAVGAMVELLEGRISHLQKQLAEREAEIEWLNAQLSLVCKGAAEVRGRWDTNKVAASIGDLAQGSFAGRREY